FIDVSLSHHLNPEKSCSSCLKKYGRENSPSPIQTNLKCDLGSAGFDDREDHQQCKQHQRLDQRQTKNHHRLDSTSSAGVTRRAFARRSTNARLSERTTKNRDRETNAGGQRSVL